MKDKRRAILILLSIVVIVSVVIRIARRDGRVYVDDDIEYSETVIESKEVDMSDQDVKDLFNF
ncbi:MAG: hypothetical protein R3Y04_01935 [Rikenellaceae bacterium]